MCVCVCVCVCGGGGVRLCVCVCGGSNQIGGGQYFELRYFVVRWPFRYVIGSSSMNCFFFCVGGT